MGIHNSIYSFRDKLDKYSDLIPVVFFIGSTLMLINVFINNQYGILTDNQYLNTDWYLNHFLSGSGLSIILMFSKSKTYRWFSYACLVCVCCIWLLNLIYVILNFQADIYYMCFVLAIYAIFVIATVAKITNRC